jgi:hypothetical protein
MTPQRPPATTRLEFLAVGEKRAVLAIDGKQEAVEGPALAALQSLQRSALAELAAREATPREAPGWFSRVANWISGLFRPSQGRPGPAAPPVVEGRKVEAGKAEPQLQSIFADKDGVHLTLHTEKGREAKPVTITCALDSEVAQRLQDCYGQLAKLGHPVAGFEILSPKPEARAAKPALVMDVGHPAPKGAIRETRILKGPDTLMTALRSGADPTRETGERLTHLRGSLGKTGLQIAEVGLGEGPSGGPARWEAVAKWIAREAEPQVAKAGSEPEP